MSWNLGRIFGTALIVSIAGHLQEGGMAAKTAWSYALGCSALVVALLAVYHGFMLPRGALSHRPHDAAEVIATFGDTLRAFFAKKQIWGMLLFVFLYRSGEGFLLMEAPLFLQAPLADLLDRIRRCGPRANGLTKRLLQSLAPAPETFIEAAADAFTAALRGPEGQEGVAAFVEKRKPRWYET